MPYTITHVSENVRQWGSEKAGPMTSYRINLKDSAGVETQNVELAQKAATPAPTVGQSLDGNIDNTEYGLKFKKAYTAGGGGGGGRPKDPAERAAIAASVALREGREALEQAMTIGLVKADKIEGIEDHAYLWRRYAEFAFRFIESKSKAA